MNDLVRIIYNDVYDVYDLKTDTTIPKDWVFVYSRKHLLEDDSSQKLFHQFNLDFDRQQITINNKKCQSRLVFFKHLAPLIRKNSEMHCLLLLNQQTILAHVIRTLHQILTKHRHHYAIRDSKQPTDISITTSLSGQVEVQVHKELMLVDFEDPDLIINVVDIRVICSNLKDKTVHAYVKFQF